MEMAVSKETEAAGGTSGSNGITEAVETKETEAAGGTSGSNGGMMEGVEPKETEGVAAAAADTSSIISCLASGARSSTLSSELILPSRAGGDEGDDSPSPTRKDAATSAARRSATTTVFDGNALWALLQLVPLASLTNESGLSRPLSLSGPCLLAFSRLRITPPIPPSPSPPSLFPSPFLSPSLSADAVRFLYCHTAPPVEVPLPGDAASQSASLAFALTLVPKLVLALLLRLVPALVVKLELALVLVLRLALRLLWLALLWLALLGVALLWLALLGITLAFALPSFWMRLTPLPEKLPNALSARGTLRSPALASTRLGASRLPLLALPTEGDRVWPRPLLPPPPPLLTGSQTATGGLHAPASDEDGDR